MSLVLQIKADQLQARKDRAKATAASLTTLLGDVEAIGKNDGNRETTDDETIAVIKKFIKNIDITIDNSHSGYEHLVDLHNEKDLLEAYLPAQLSEEEITKIVDDLCIQITILAEPLTMKCMGQIMKHLNENYSGQFDGSLASSIVKKRLM